MSDLPQLEQPKADETRRTARRSSRPRPSAARRSARIQSKPHAERDLRLDFFRGLALLCIFVDHIPGNFLSNITLHSVAFSDAAEVFVFVSGYAAALAYGTILNSRGLLAATLRIYHRIWQLYVAHILTFIIMAAIVLHHAMMHSEFPADAYGMSKLANEPQVALGKALLLQFQPDLLNILPLYIVLLSAFPIVLLLIAWHPLLALIPSATLYLLTQFLGWQVHGYPAGSVWFFNPLAWQFLFVVGAVLAYPQRPGTVWIPKAAWFTVSAATMTVLGATTNISWVLHFNDADVPGILLHQLAPYAGDKSNLDPLRLISFLALAIASVRFLRPESKILRGRVAAWLIACGQNSLYVFCLGILLSVFGYFALTSFQDGVGLQLAINVTGCALLIGLAELLNWFKAGQTALTAR